MTWRRLVWLQPGQTWSQSGDDWELLLKCGFGICSCGEPVLSAIQHVWVFWSLLSSLLKCLCFMKGHWKTPSKQKKDFVFVWGSFVYLSINVRATLVGPKYSTWCVSWVWQQWQTVVVLNVPYCIWQHSLGFTYHLDWLLLWLGCTSRFCSFEVCLYVFYLHTLMLVVANAPIQ